MKPLVRTIGMAVLAAALLNASAGLCFCHRGPTLRGQSTDSAGCCHGLAPTTTALNSPGSCCHIESADSSAAPAAAIQLAPPAAVPFAVVDAMPAAEVLPVAEAALTGCSPPAHVLRI